MQATEIQSLKAELASAIMHLTQVRTFEQMTERMEEILNEQINVLSEFRALKRQRGGDG